ncbi:hypothetical protein DXG03_000279 [Asterophora parasitica]|uniref:Protein EFR3 n=1 Tax=Asterophora parasitica TaxID=117018 RepID=A0A9P7KHM1_9AGAR|nr:hypothetical protein DXG03_000279 [Asterophora parasitica]
MRPILTTLFETEVDTLNEQAAAAKGASSSPYLAEFRTRPAMERRAASIHVHIDGDKGPSMVEVSNASLRALISLAGHANSPQIGFIMHSLVDNIEEARAWGNLHHCCWLAQKMVEWSQYQYRYAVPTWLVERLCRSQETSSSPTHYRVLAEMATTVFRSPNPLVNLSTSDIASNLTTLLLRRTESDPEDPLVPALIECIASLGRHVYYSDQIQDLAGELINRIVIVEVQGALSRGKTGSAKSRTQAVRSLLAALLGLIQAAAKEDPGASSHSGHGPPSTPAEIFKQEIAANGRVSRRTTVPPDIWQDTLSLLCDDDYMVRADYSDALIFYLSEEMTKHGDTADGKRLSEGPLSQAVKINLLLHAGNHGTKLLHAIHAYLYILATSSTLGLTSSSSTSSSHSTHEGSPNVNVNVFPPIPNKDDDNEGPESTLSQYGRPSTSAPQSPRARKVTVVQRLLDQTPPGLSTSTSARLTDYTLILDILTTVHEELPVRGLLTGIPMLIALDDVVSNAQNPEDPATIQRIDAIRELIAKVWLALGGVWNSPELVKLAESALASGPGSLPTVERTNLVAHLPPRHAVEFPQDRTANTPWSGVNVQTALALLTASPGVHEATGLDRETLMRRLSTKWTAEIALRDSIERSSSFENTVRADGLAPLLKISPALMHIENISQASLACSTRGVGVADLRGALEGRSSMSNPALGRPASISTLEHAPSTLEGGHLKLTQTRSRPQSRSKKRSTPNGTGEVRDVLNRLGIGKQNGSLLKASFPALQKSDQRAPPYKS